MGRTYGVSLYTRAVLIRCGNTSPSYTCYDDWDHTSYADGDSDEGYYRYYAGPVSVWARGHCIQWWGSIRDTDGRDYTAFPAKAADYCGA